MGVIETGAIFNGFTFDGENSKDYGVYITGSGVFNAPERDVEMISIPGRDGAFAQDKGRFSNIEVTYPAGLFGVDRADFAQAISDFRNMLASRKGYCRLEDDYNPGEYRMAVFKAGVDVTPASLESGEFSVTFDCKPQRFLTSGETAVALSSGDDITNPTLFDARPVLQVWGYGHFALDNDAFEIISGPLGAINFGEIARTKPNTTAAVAFPTALLAPGNQFYGDNDTNTVIRMAASFQTDEQVTNATIGTATDWDQSVEIDQDGYGFTVALEWRKTFTAQAGTTETRTATVTLTMFGGTTETVTINISATYTSALGQDAILANIAVASMPADWTRSAYSINAYTLRAYSTASALGSPIYFDLETGEAYKIEDDVPVSVDNSVSIPVQLPTLPPGATNITYDNTITQFKVVTRWWKV